MATTYSFGHGSHDYAGAAAVMEWVAQHLEHCDSLIVAYSYSHVFDGFSDQSASQPSD